MTHRAAAALAPCLAAVLVTSLCSPSSAMAAAKQPAAHQQQWEVHEVTVATRTVVRSPDAANPSDAWWVEPQLPAFAQSCVTGAVLKGPITAHLVAQVVLPVGDVRSNGA